MAVKDFSQCFTFVLTLRISDPSNGLLTQDTGTAGRVDFSWSKRSINIISILPFTHLQIIIEAILVLPFCLVQVLTVGGC